LIYDLGKKSREPVEVVEKIEKNIIYGKIGTYALYDDDDDNKYGLYIEISHKPVLLVLFKDEFIGEREKWAATLFENTETIDKNFQKFVSENPDIQGETIHRIEFFSKNLTQGEVTLDSEWEEMLSKDIILTGFDFETRKPIPWWKPTW
jgi:hypothetical protein